MRGRAVLVLLGITALGAYSLGRQNPPVSNPARTPGVQQPKPLLRSQWPSLARQRKPPSVSQPPVHRLPRLHPPRSACPRTLHPLALTPSSQGRTSSASSRPDWRQPPLSRSSSKRAAHNTTQAEGHAPVPMTQCGMVERAVDAAHTRDRAVLRRFVTRAT
jgi:hypothetical protein